MKKVKSIFLLSTTIILVASSCSKDGTNGTNGTNGAAGAKGDTGTANVIYSGWTKAEAWTGPDNNEYAANIFAPKIDSNILQTGDVRVYVNTGATQTNPFPFPYNGGTSYIRYGISPKVIHLYSNVNTWSAETYYRYVIIPGGLKARTSANVDWNDYNSVKAYLGLKD